MDIHLQYYQHLFDYHNLKIKETLMVGNTVAVVGNSGILSGSQKGDEIDEHDYVVRFNSAPTKRYEEDVGSRTTHRFLNVLLQRGGELDHTTATQAQFVEGLRDQTLILKSTHNTVQKRAQSRTHKSCEVLPMRHTYSKFFEKVIDEFFDQNWPARNLSLGMQGALIFLASSNKMDMYGFNAYTDSRIADYHYWEEFTEDDPGPHRYGTEHEMLNKFDGLKGVEVHQ